MAIGIGQVFNSTGDVGMWLNASTTNVTGSLFMSVLIIIGFFLLMMMLFKMPELLMGLVLMPLMIVFVTISEITTPMKFIVGALILLIGFGLWSFYPTK